MIKVRVKNALNKAIEFAHKREQRYVLVSHIHFNNLQNQLQTRKDQRQ